MIYFKVEGDMKRNMLDFLAGPAGRLTSLGRPDQVPLQDALDLPQRDEVWECTDRRARAWITPRDREPYRPYMILTVSRTGRVRGSEIVEDAPTTAQVVNALAKAMLYPAPGAGARYRPTVVYVDNEVLTRALAPELKEIGVRCEFRHTLREAERALRALADFMGYEDAIPGLLEVPGVTPFMAKGLFEAAAFFFRETPWRWIDDGQPIEIHYPVDSQPRYAVVMGHGGQAYGLAIYNSTDVLYETYAGTPPDQLIGREVWTALLFGEAHEMPFDDLDAIEAYDWPVAGTYAYPLLLQMGLSEKPTRPSKSELLRIEAALRAIPSFVREHMEADERLPRPAEATLSVTVAGREDRITLIYPVPDFEMPAQDGWPSVTEQAVIHERNAELLDAFEQWLREQELSAKTIQKHLDNVGRFAEHYLAEVGGTLELPCSADEAAPADVDVFLADWLLYEQDHRPVEGVRSHIASLKKFYLFLRETEEMPAEEADEILDLLREDRGYYLDLASDFEEGISGD
jgi:hypothetical protein